MTTATFGDHCDCMKCQKEADTEALYFASEPLPMLSGGPYLTPLEKELLGALYDLRSEAERVTDNPVGQLATIRTMADGYYEHFLAKFG